MFGGVVVAELSEELLRSGLLAEGDEATDGFDGDLVGVGGCVGGTRRL